ncbi:hypothetical protein HA050_03935 [Iodobacter sp. HSC-16F04]|uniref:DUF6869 domain-containing protein n=1 Tax=Iodobacter violaceini TaxID=3044271 RepID=A0ABX0KSF6_9NEIS|nr:hypothetical protein [Iodobacter violacea]NHQ85260.1 hypothetical protein [Iodobacter violacea]
MNQSPVISPELISAWIKIQHAGAESEIADQLWWAWEEVFFFSQKNPEHTFAFILATLREDSSNKIMANLSAGPLEDLIENFGESMIEKIEQEAKTNPLFASLLGGVWQGSTPDEIWSRVTAAWDRRGWDGLPDE